MNGRYQFSMETLPEARELRQLFAQTTWASRRSEREIARLLRSTTIFVAAWDGEKLIGFGRAISDGVFRALLDDIVVDEAFRGRGIGSSIVERLTERLAGVEEVYLNARESMHDYYRPFGFERNKGLTMKKKNLAAESSGAS